jgi:soluble lytic murein transglycosylase-like protein
MTSGRFSVAIPVLLAVALWTGAGAAADRASGSDAASLTPGRIDLELTFPRILAPADIERYRAIFEAQEDGDWKIADRLIAELGNRVLLGHVLAQRYLHPTAYRSQYKELKDWLDHYADHPDAGRLYKLARLRQPKGWRPPKPPIETQGPGVPHESIGTVTPGRSLNRADRRRVRELQANIRSYLRRGYTLTTKKLLDSDEAKRLFSTAEYDQARAQLGQGYFTAGRDDWALEWAGAAAARSGRYLPEANWTAGLAAWRLKKYDVAAGHFEAVAQGKSVSPWLVSAGAFWAARARLVHGDPEKVNALFAIAAQHPRTFYGLLARHIRGEPVNFRWAMPPLADTTVRDLSAKPAGLRAMALLQVGENRRAERELRNLSATADDAMAKGILALAARGNMPSLAVLLDTKLFPNGGGYDGAAYPLPDWSPEGGFRVDRALIYAFIRQESRFNPKAKSWAGAHGLMQLMPRTASFVAGDRGYHRHGNKRRELFEPELNLSLGQKYIEILLADENIQGDLFRLAAAWNGGPGNLRKWDRATEYMNDPLFFIESLPSRETRIFIERVLSNLWIYRHRLGQSAPSLEAIAAGRWPVYTALGQEPAEVAESDGSRK